VTEVEIFWPASLPAEPALEAEELLREAGVDATCRLQPVRRGPDTVLVLMSTVTLEPFFGLMFERYGIEAVGKFRKLVGVLLRRPHEEKALEGQEKKGPKSVVFEAPNGAQFIFTSNLPEDAFRKALDIGPSPQKGRWMWDVKNEDWLCFETR
jgi:hypothetical protein